MQTFIFKIKPAFASQNGIPDIFPGVELTTSSKAAYLYGNQVDCWVPKSCILGATPTNKVAIMPPQDHQILQSKNAARKAFLNGKTIIISFPYNQELLTKVRTLPDRRWNQESKTWRAPVSMEAVEKLTEWEFDISAEISEWYAGVKGFISEERPQSFPISGLKRQLYPYQVTGAEFVEAHRGRALLADEQGLGKTCQSLAYLQAHPEIRPAVIVVPASLKLNWGREIDSWMSEKCQWRIINGKKPSRLKPTDIYIINYDVLSAWIDRLIELKPAIVIIDEAQLIKNQETKRTKAVKKLAQEVPHFIALSGTPIDNRPVEFYNVISFIEPGLFPSFFKYAQKYCDAVMTRFGWDFTGASNMEELHKLLTETIMIRRLKKDVLKDLPPKIRSIVPMELENSKEYAVAEDDFINWLRGIDVKKAERAEKAEALSRIEGLKQLTIAGKIRQCCNWIENFIESGEKLVVFTTHKNTIDTLMTVFSDVAVKLDGSTNMADRQTAVERFQTDPSIKLFIGNIKAAGVGITLTAASNACVLELPWTSVECDQAEDRIHRIGQDAESITIWYLLADNTIDTEIASLLDGKRQVLSAVLDGEEIETNNIFAALLGWLSKR